MKKKTACLISCSDHYGHRLHLFDGILKDMGYETTYITSDFDHTTKSVFQSNVPGAVQLPAKPYGKNLSPERILSHWGFARDVFRYLEALPREPDALVVLVPPNFLAYYAARYKKRHPRVKLIFDIFDLWPETFPSNKGKLLLSFPFGVWKTIRDRSLPAADGITTVCDLFRRRLGLEERAAVVPLCAEALGQGLLPGLSREELTLCYLGAINNVVDIPRICGLLEALVKRRPVALHIIGTGERQQALIDGAEAAGVRVVFHGPVYDEEEKKRIMSRCHFGLNIMRESVCVGLTMKSVDYFRYGLPIVNSIPADTEELIRAYGVGIQMGPGCEEEILSAAEAPLEMRERVRALFADRFETARVREVCAGVLRELL